MSSENDDQISPDDNAETLCESRKHSKLSYTRDFLLSLSELAICKRLPSGFDQSLLSEFEDASHGIQEWQRIPGSLPLQSFKRGEYGSSPPTRGDSSNYSRGTYGRWENRSYGRNDKDNDSQSDWHSESVKRYNNQSRQSWQSSEHDGLLGSGSFQRPPGVLAPKVRPNDHSQPDKNSELYHPPRPHKAVPHARSTTDSYNDETFGSTECTSDDRAEEERRRRDSFESMRKEQKKALQEQKLNSNKHRIDPLSEALLEDTEDEKKHLASTNVLDESLTLQISKSDSRTSSFTSQIPASRPLVPPGFATAIPERNSGMKSSTLDRKAEIGSTSSDQPLLNKGEKVVNLSCTLQVPRNNPGLNDQLYRASSLSKSPGTLDSHKITELDTEEGSTHEATDNPNRDNSTSVLQKLFGNASTVNSGGSSGYVEHCDSKPDDTWSPRTVPSSKFSHWFLEEERKPLSSARDLLSLVGGEKAETQVSDAKAGQLISSTIGISEQLIVINIQGEIPTVLTCEDLEQTILSEFTENSSTSQQPVPNVEHPKTDTDNLASHHLLSLLQKGKGPKEITNPNLEVESKNKVRVSEAPNTEDTQKHLGNTPTLETLFGNAFMKELQSVEAPVSVQRGSVTSSSVGDNESYRVLAPNQREQTKMGKVENWLGLNDPRSESDSLKLQSNAVPKYGSFDGIFELQLPEEESLMTVSDPLNTSFTPVIMDERSMVGQDGPPFVHGSYHPNDPNISYHTHSQQQSSPKFHSPMNHRRTLFNHSLDPHPAHINSQMNLQFPPNMLRPPFGDPNVGQTEFDLSGHRPMLQQTHMLGNFPPQLLRENPRGAPFLQPHSQTTGFVPDSNPVQTFSLGHRQPNFRGLEMPLPAPDMGSGNNYPEAFQRLIETELWANPKQMIHPFAGLGHNSQGIYGDELDIGFRHR